MRKIALALSALLIALPVTTSAAEPYTIPVVIPLTGAGAFSGQAAQETLRVYEQMINRTGGIGGRPLRFDVHDDQSSPVVAVQLTNAIMQSHPALVIGSMLTSMCLAMAAVVTSGPVQYCISPGPTFNAGGYSFAGSATLGYIVMAMVRFVRQKGFRRLAILTGTDATGQAAIKATNDALALPENSDIKVVANEVFTPGDITVAAQITRIKAANPEAILTWASGTPFGTVLHSLKDAGVDLPLIASAVNMDRKQLSGYAAILPTQLYFNAFTFIDAAHLPAGPQKRAIDQFYAAFKAAGEQPGLDNAIPWDPIHIAVSALRKLGPTADAAQLRTYLANLRGFVGIYGTYDLTLGDQHGLTDKSVMMVRWIPQTNDWLAASGPGGVVAH